MVLEGFQQVSLLLGILTTTTDQLWPYIHTPLLVGYVPLLLFPRWKGTRYITLFIPFVYGVMYASIFVPMMMLQKSGSTSRGDDEQEQEPKPDLSNMESIYNLFRQPDIFFVGWIHYLCFDMLVSRGIALDAIDTYYDDLHYLLYILLIWPCILACFYCGPVGYIMYVTIKYTILEPMFVATSGSRKNKTEHDTKTKYAKVE